MYIIYYEQQFFKYQRMKYLISLLVYGNVGIHLFPVFVSCFL